MFFKTKSIFSVDLNKTNEDILNDFPQIAEVEISRGFPHTLNIAIIERLALATWCQKENCFLLDKEGIIFEETQAKEVFVKIRNAEEIDLFTLGKEVIDKEYLGKIFNIQRKLTEEFKIKTKEFIIFSEHLNVKTSEDWEIYLNPQEDISWQLTKLGAVLEEEIPPERRKDLEYIELRFGNLAPYKYRSFTGDNP